MRFFLTDEKSDNNEQDAQPFAPRQHLIEKEEHPQGGKCRTNNIEGIGLRDAHLAECVAEKDECDNAGKDGEISYATERCQHLGIGDLRLDVGESFRAFADEPNRQEEQEADELRIEDK